MSVRKIVTVVVMASVSAVPAVGAMALSAAHHTTVSVSADAGPQATSSPTSQATGDVDTPWG